MFEICAFLAPKTPKVRASRKPSIPRIAAGMVVMVGGSEIATVIGRDTKYANAWTIRSHANDRVMSVERCMIRVG